MDDDAFEAVRVAREAEAVGLLSGAWLAGRRGALVCQSRGLANCVNALGSHAKADGLPFVGVVGGRGGLGDHNFAQVPAGYPMARLIDDLAVRNRTLDSADDVGRCVDLAARTAFSAEDAYVLLLDRTLTETDPGR